MHENELAAAGDYQEATPEYCAYVEDALRNHGFVFPLLEEPCAYLEPHCGRCGWLAAKIRRSGEFICFNNDCRHHWRMKNGQPETMEEIWVAGRE